MCVLVRCLQSRCFFMEFLCLLMEKLYEISRGVPNDEEVTEEVLLKNPALEKVTTEHDYWI